MCCLVLSIRSIAAPSVVDSSMSALGQMDVGRSKTQERGADLECDPSDSNLPPTLRCLGSLVKILHSR